MKTNRTLMIAALLSAGLLGACDASKEELDKTKTQLTSVTTERDTLKTQLATAQAQIAASQQQLADSQKKVEEHQKRWDEHQATEHKAGAVTGANAAPLPPAKVAEKKMNTGGSSTDQ